MTNHQSNWNICLIFLAFSELLFIHPIFSSFGFGYFGHFSCMIFFPFFFHLAHLALENVNKDYVIFSYFHNFVAKSDQKPKTKNGMNETQMRFIQNKMKNKCEFKLALNVHVLHHLSSSGSVPYNYTTTT